MVQQCSCDCGNITVLPNAREYCHSGQITMAAGKVWNVWHGYSNILGSVIISTVMMRAGAGVQPQGTAGSAGEA